MNNEQNINDILKLLKSSYDDSMGDGKAEPDISENEEMTNEELQSRLKARFAASADSAKEASVSESEYKLDEEFFVEESDVSEDISTVIVLEKEENEEPLTEKEESDISEEIQDDDIGTEQTVEVLEDEEDDGIPPFDLEEPAISIEEEGSEAVGDEYETESEDLSELLCGSWDESEDLVAVEAKGEAETEAEPEQAYEFYSSESGQLALFEDSASQNDELTDIAENAVDEHVDEDQMVLDFGDPCDCDGISESDTEESNIDSSFLGLMLEVGDNVPIGKNPSAERVDIYDLDLDEGSVSLIEQREAFGFNGEEYKEAQQTDDILYSYSKDKKYTLLRLMGTSFFAVLLAAFELLPKLHVKLFGVLNYEKYPTVYLLLCVQLLVFAGIFAWRELFAGLKRAFCFKADIWSFSAIITVAALVYEITLAFLSPLSLPNTYGTFAAIYILLGLVCEYLSVKRELKSFEVYSCDSIKYTLRTEALANSAAEKMYRGGISSKVNIFEPSQVSFPNGYFSEANKKKESDALINGFITPMILAGAVFWVLSMIIGVTLVDSLEIFMLTLSALCPAAIFISRVLPMYIASSRLYDRESAIASEASAKKYASCDILVFRDSHLFKDSKPENNGIVIYDKKNTRKIVRYLNALYAAVGGPMKTLFESAAEEKLEPTLKRIARNGIEAVIDSHSVILGDAEFQRRYGISFPDGELVRAGEGIICMSIDGVPSAKLCLKYATEPIFEMIVSKMEEDGIGCAIETYDPVINSAFVAASRRAGKTPINVVHKNVNDYYSEMPENVDGSVGVVACSSRLKLVECVVWCKRIFAAKKACFKVHCVMAGITLALLTLLLLTGYWAAADQYACLLLQAVGIIPTVAVILKKLPKRDHFSVEGEEDQTQEQGNRE